jgi:site-specific DNA recombinase
MPPKAKKVVAYCRVSTLEQKKKGYGIDIQIRDVSVFAEHQGLIIEKFYKDEGESGVRENRKALKQLMRECRAGNIAIIILPSLDRLSREVRISENLFHEFNKLGISILISDMPNYKGEHKDILIRQIFEAIAEENRRDIIERLLKGRRERVIKGLFPGGNLPYGYVREGKIVKIHFHEAEIVRQIYKRASSCTGQEIANILNGKGYKRRNGKAWNQRQVCRLLKYKRLYQEGLLHYGSVIKKAGQWKLLFQDIDTVH